MQTSIVFQRNENGVRHMRIPALCRAHDGTLLAFCEARDGGDQSPTDLVLKRSADNGDIWGPLQLVVKARGRQAIMNPCAVTDRTTGTSFCFANVFPEHEEGKPHAESRREPGCIRTVFTRSDDDGITWSPLVDLSDTLVDSATEISMATGPGCGVQTKDNGALLIPFTFRNLSTQQGWATVLRSSDHGETWRCGSRVETTSMETQVAQLSGGRLRMDMRNDREQEQPVHCRYYALSDDGGQTWDGPFRDPGLRDVRCQASMISTIDRSGKHLLLHSSPDAEYAHRVNLTVRVSTDDGETWQAAHRVHPDPCAYSCMTALPGDALGVLYEGGEERIKEGIRFACMSLAVSPGPRDAEQGKGEPCSLQ